MQTLAIAGKCLLSHEKMWSERWCHICKDLIEAFPPNRNIVRLLDEATQYNSTSCICVLAVF